MRQLLVVLALVAALMAASRVAPQPGPILPADFSKDFPEHREHHEQLLHNLGQKPLQEYPGAAVRMWWVGPNPQRLFVVEPAQATEITYETDGYKPRVLKQVTRRRDMTAAWWAEIERFVFHPEIWEMSTGPGDGPFTVGGKTWILELKRGQRYRCLEKIDPIPPAFSDALSTLTTPPLPRRTHFPTCPLSSEK